MALTFGITMVKDEADIVATTVRHMLGQVDHVLIADNGSTDGTRELLDEMTLTHTLTVIDDPEPAYYQSRKMSQLANVARAAGADWVVPFDADEVWLSPHGRIADVLEGDIATAPIFNHVATATDPDLGPVERLRWRLRDPLPLRKVACRALPGLTIHAGNHGASYEDHRPQRVDGLLEVRHFPYRSPEQFVRKARNGAAAYAATDLPRTTGLHWREYGELIEAGGDEAGEAWFREHFCVGDPENDPDLIYDPAPVAERGLTWTG